MRTRQDMTTLEARFHRETVAAYMDACTACGYSEPRLLQMMHEHGAVKAAKVILCTNRFLYALAELGRYDCLERSLEFLVLQPRYVSFFREHDRRLAKSRLLGWKGVHAIPAVNTQRTGFSYAL
jgi:hypothetical protein